MAKSRRRLEYDERCPIRARHMREVSLSEIAHWLGCYKSTVSRELRRNRGSNGCFHN